MNQNVENAFDKLVKEIWGYESDTFSAAKEDLACEEAEDIANDLVECAIWDMIQCRTLDGDILKEQLKQLREE